MVKLIGPNWELDRIQNVIFDKDGTLTDLHLYWGRIVELRAKVLEKNYGLPMGQLCKIMGYDWDEGLLLSKGPVGLYSREKVIDIVHIACKEDYGVFITHEVLGILFDRANGMFQDELFDYVELLPGAEFLLDTLRQNDIQIALVTSDSIISTEKVLLYLGIDKYFDVVIGRESCKESKNTGTPCKMALDTLKANPFVTVTIGDSPVDIIMGQQNGCLAGIGVATGQTPESELRTYNVCTVNSLTDIIVGVGSKHYVNDISKFM
jgi:phosphoglycolate phosphatase